MATTSASTVICDGAIAVICPNCGSPSPAQLSSPDRMHCLSCGYQGAPYPEAQRQLTQVAEMLFRIDARERQLSNTQRKTLLASKIFGVGMILMGLSIVLPVLSAIFYLAVVPYTLGEDIAVMAGVGAPTLFMGVVGFVCLGIVTVKRRKLLTACSAIPPVRIGDRFRCRVCGGDLYPEKAAPVARCEYCSADSVVSPEAISRAQAHRGVAAQAIEQEVSRQATAAAQMTVGWAITLTILTLCMSPFLLVASAVFVGMGIKRMESEVNTAERYAVWTIDSQSCLGQLGKNDSELSFGDAPPRGFPKKVTIPPGQHLEQLQASGLVGKLFRSGDYDAYPAISTYRRVVARENSLRLQAYDGFEEIDVRGACLANNTETLALAQIQGWSGPVLGDEDAVFMTDVTNASTTLWRIGLKDTVPRPIFKSEKIIVELQQDTNTIYFGQHDGLRSIAKTGGAVTLIAKTISMSGFCSSGEYLYTSHNVSASDYAIVRVAKQGGAKTTIATLNDMPCAFACSASHVYWFTCNQQNAFAGGDLYRASLKGGTAEPLARNVKRPAQNTQATILNGRLYWAEQDSTKVTVYVLGTDNSVKVLVSDPHGGKGFWVDQKNVYWGNWGNIFRVALTGGTVDAISFPGSAVGAVTTLGPYLFVGDDSRKRVIRMAKP